MVASIRMPKSKCPGTEPYLGTFQILNGDLGKYTHFLQAILFFSTFFSVGQSFNESWIELRVLVRCCLMHKSIITLRHILYLLYLYLCLELSPFMLYLCDLRFIFIMINCIISWIQAHMFFCLVLEYVLLFLDDNLVEECELI